ncbi:MAG TPA: hypothetical protein VLI04_00975, partial [Nocardioidaceae bacterium]|nr:hypothetical protein [Nocardioidaceae bacterium]
GTFLGDYEDVGVHVEVEADHASLAAAAVWEWLTCSVAVTLLHDFTVVLDPCLGAAEDRR